MLSYFADSLEASRQHPDCGCALKSRKGLPPADMSLYASIPMSCDLGQLFFEEYFLGYDADGMGTYDGSSNDDMETEMGETTSLGSQFHKVGLQDVNTDLQVDVATTITTVEMPIGDCEGTASPVSQSEEPEEVVLQDASAIADIDVPIQQSGGTASPVLQPEEVVIQDASVVADDDVPIQQSEGTASLISQPDVHEMVLHEATRDVPQLEVAIVS
ncbi:unnamed protein product [Calypogeia fissa]